MTFTREYRYFGILLRCRRSELWPDESGVGCEDGERGILALDVIFHGAEYLLIQRHHVHHHLLLKFHWLKNTVLSFYWLRAPTPAEENSAFYANICSFSGTTCTITFSWNLIGSSILSFYWLRAPAPAEENSAFYANICSFSGTTCTITFSWNFFGSIILSFYWLRAPTPAEENSGLFNVSDLLNYVNCPVASWAETTRLVCDVRCDTWDVMLILTRDLRLYYSLILWDGIKDKNAVPSFLY